MFSVIVVDDEMMIRTSISTFINNCDVGFEVVGTFRDGSDAIKYLEENNVDLVISDIRMVQVSGIDLCSIYLRKQNLGRKLFYLADMQILNMPKRLLNTTSKNT